MNKLSKYILRWRSKHCFGVQSPSAYYFIRYVVREKYPYYHYKEISEFAGDQNDNQQKLYKFFFRLANYSQADSLFVDSSNEETIECFRLGCRKTKMYSHDEWDSSRDDVSIIIIRCISGCLESYGFILNDDNYTQQSNCVNENTLFIIEGINNNEEALKEWERIVRCEDMNRTYDVVNFGLVFMNKNGLKEHYYVDI